MNNLKHQDMLGATQLETALQKKKKDLEALVQ